MPLHPGLRAIGAQGRTDKYGALETLGGRPRVSVAFVPKAAAWRRASRLAAGGDPLHPAPRPQGAEALEAMRLAGVLPPWHDGCHGSRKGQCPLIPNCALCAQGHRGTCDLAGVLPPRHDGSHGSRKGQCPLTPNCALCAQGHRGTCGLAGVLPPWHDGCHGSPVWRGFLPIGRYRPPSGNRPSGSRKWPT